MLLSIAWPLKKPLLIRDEVSSCWFPNGPAGNSKEAVISIGIGLPGQDGRPWEKVASIRRGVARGVLGNAA